MANVYPFYVSGSAVETSDHLVVSNPWDGSEVGRLCKASTEHVEQALSTMPENAANELTRYERHSILRRAAVLMAERREEFAKLICREAGLCMKETMYETGRSSDVLEFAAIEALRDDGQVFSCDLSPQGKARKIVTFRQPLTLMSAITPFNHPLNQVVHKLAPAIAAGVPVILKPSDKTPLTAVRFTELLYEAGLPPTMLSTLVGEIDPVVNQLIEDARIELVSFTGSVEIGKLIAGKAGYKKVCLELGGNSPLIVMDDADLELAVKLAAEGCFRNSGQRCTAVKRLLVHRTILSQFTEAFVEKAREYRAGDPSDPETRVGTVIDEPAAAQLKSRVDSAVEMGARVLLGGGQRGALMEPTVIENVPRDAEMVAKESFGPLAPIIPIDSLEDAIEYYNSGTFGLSSGIVTKSLDHAFEAVKRLRCGTTNINEVPGYRIESSPFGGVKDSGLGIKEGVIEAMKYMTNVKTFSMPW